MKKLILAVLMWPLVALAQTFTYPSVTFQNLTVLGTFSGGPFNLGPQAANSVIANATSSTANPTAVSVPSCSTSSNAIQWTSGSGFACNSSINAASLGGVSAAGYAPLASPTFTGAPLAPTAGLGGNSQQLATTAFVANRSGCRNIEDWGGIANGVFDNTAAFNQAKSLGNCVYLGPGNWYFAGPISITSGTTNPASYAVVGAGPDLTQLTFASGGNGLTMSLDGQYNSAHVRDLTIATKGVGTGAGLQFSQQATTISNPALTALSDVTNVVIRGADGYAATDYWNTALYNIGVSNVNYTGLVIIGSSGQLGVGLTFGGGTSTLPPVQFNVTGSMFMNLQNGIDIATSYYQGITVNQSNFTANANAGIVVQSGLTGFDQLTITNSQFANKFGIQILSQFQNLMISGNLFIEQNISGVVGIYNSAAVLFTITNNTFQNANAPSLSNGLQGIYLNNTSGVAGVISGNVFRYMSPAIYLDTSAQGVNVQSNAYFNNNTNISNNGGTACPPSGSGNCLGTSSTP